ncbi:29863_t:CDS:2 [Gigaspora margarita]|uniref:29863_t:CDS:1 n=1 Tax=Gigaspora margarita TaxID=4874 RepID=A0ABN7ULE1_GIGMA|nr:29863_t:CDS:2 [Gigaspora margarita]
MPCHIDAIVRVNQVHLTISKDLNLIVVWAIGVYPLEILLVGIAQDVMKGLNEENAIVNVSVKNYIGKIKYNFMAIIVIKDNLYTNAVDISYIDIPFVIKVGCYSSRHVRVDDETDDYVKYINLIFDENKHVSEYNKEHKYKSDEFLKIMKR